jgi:predicted RNA-binding protein YlqC (UPF0109 family)
MSHMNSSVVENPDSVEVSEVEDADSKELTASEDPVSAY